MEENNYKYDLFLSYVRKYPYGEWVNDIFLPLFKPYLEDALNQDVHIFIDIEDIQGGDSWKNRIYNALAYSKCLVSIWTPSYFRSKWCLGEFNVMHFRQKKIGCLTIKRPNGLIIPFILFDGVHFQHYKEEMQTYDCTKYNLVADGMKKTIIYTEFQSQLQGWIYKIADSIKNAPQWCDDWLTDDWLQNPFNDVDPDNPKGKSPRL